MYALSAVTSLAVFGEIVCAVVAAAFLYPAIRRAIRWHNNRKFVEGMRRCGINI